MLAEYLEENIFPNELLAEHPSVGSGDVVIAATCIETKCPLLTLDKDFNFFCDRGLKLLSWEG